MKKNNQETIEPTAKDTTTGAIEEAVEKAIEATKKKGRPPKAHLSISRLKTELAEMGITLRHNVITNEVEVTPPCPILDDFIARLHSDLGEKYSGASVDTLRLYIPSIAREDSYNPILELMEATKWDGESRLASFLDLLRIPENDELSRILVVKWLLQSMALQFNDITKPFGSEGVLVFTGPQGTGKTSIAKHLALRDRLFCESGMISDADKDFERRLVTCFIGEIGELDATFRKADISKIKGFITRGVDTYRLQYGRTDTRLPRRTSMVGTVNEGTYLVDTTGNRRFFTVPITKKIPYAELDSFDYLQLWAEIYTSVVKFSYEGKEACFRLLPDEEAQLAKRNCQCTKPIKAEPECRDILSMYPKEDGWQIVPLTTTEFKDHFSALSRYDTGVIGKALDRIGIISRKSNGKIVRDLPTGLRAK